MSVRTAFPVGHGDELVVVAARELDLGDLADLEEAVRPVRAWATETGLVKAVAVCGERGVDERAAALVRDLRSQARGASGDLRELLERAAVAIETTGAVA